MKSKRQEKILELITDHEIETQEQLLDELKSCGFQTTQATISRDIKQLRIIKELSASGTYRYNTTARPTEHTFSSKLNIIFRQCVTSVDYAQNIMVIKTMPGLASAACSALDGMNLPEILGTIAGDDTGFLVLRDTPAAAELCAEIREQIAH
jgi:transcriptional regulator of arginine metabolism